jgi:hypothetical protein
MMLKLVRNPAEAVYKEQINKDYQGNPYIEALEPPFSIDYIRKNVTRLPNFHEDMRQLEPFYRREYAENLENDFFLPMPNVITLEQDICQLIRAGYKRRNPVSAEYKQFVRKFLEEDPDTLNHLSTLDLLSPGVKSSAPNCRALISIGGMGKSVALNNVLGLYSQVISHTVYKGIPFPRKQVVYIKIDCPPEGSLKTLCNDFFMQMDELMGSNYYPQYKRDVNQSTLISNMKRVALNSGLGLLVIDELDRLTHSPKKSKELTDFIIRLINNIGIPVLIAGTPVCLPLFIEQFAMESRIVHIGELSWINYSFNDKKWKFFVKHLWRYQWTSVETPLNEELEKIFYSLCLGIPRIAVKLFMQTQTTLIGLPNESITPEVLEMVAQTYLSTVTKLLKDIQNYYKLSDRQKANLAVTIDLPIDFINRESLIKPKSIPKTGTKKPNTIKEQVYEQVKQFYSEVAAKMCIEEFGFLFNLEDESDIKLELPRILQRAAEIDLQQTEKNEEGSQPQGRTKQNKSASKLHEDLKNNIE